MTQALREVRCDHCFTEGLCPVGTCKHAAPRRRAKQLGLPYPEPSKQVPVPEKREESPSEFVERCMQVEKECRWRAVLYAVELLRLRR